MDVGCGVGVLVGGMLVGSGEDVLVGGVAVGDGEGVLVGGVAVDDGEGVFVGVMGVGRGGRPAEAVCSGPRSPAVTASAQMAPKTACISREFAL